MAGFAVKFDVSKVEILSRNLGRLPKETLQAVRKANRESARELRDLIRVKAPRTGSRAKEGPRHATRVGAIRRSIKAHAGAKYAYVSGGGPGAPHFVEHEFGGGVFWTRAKSSKSAREMFGHWSSSRIAERLSGSGVSGHVIPVGKATGPHVSFGGAMHGQPSRFFFATADPRIAEFQRKAENYAIEAVQKSLRVA